MMPRGAVVRCWARSRHAVARRASAAAASAPLAQSTQGSAAAVAAARNAATPVLSRRSFSDVHRIEAQHQDEPSNTESTPFEFTPENLIKAQDILRKYPAEYQKGAMLPLLDLAQRQHGGWLPLAAMNKVAKIVGCAPIAVYESASFYTMFNRKPIGKHFVNICTTTPCMLRGAYEVLEACKQELGVEVGETTPDGMFTLGEVECAGACVNAPVMAVGDDYYEDLEPKDAVRILKEFAKGKVPKMGPVNNRKTCEGTLGKTTLLEEPYGPMWTSKELTG